MKLSLEHLGEKGFLQIFYINTCLPAAVHVAFSLEQTSLLINLLIQLFQKYHLPNQNNVNCWAKINFLGISLKLFFYICSPTHHFLCCFVSYRAFAVVASALGIPSLLPFLKAVCRSKKSWQARHTGIKIVQQIAILMGCAILPHLRNLVEIIEHGKAIA